MGINGGQTLDWTPDRVALLTKLWSDGLSCRQIAGEIGGISRSAVLGKAHRLGLPSRTEHSTRPRKPRPRRTVQTIKVRSPSNGGARVEPVIVREPDPDLEEFNAAIPQEQRCTLMQLTNTTCRWPCGDVGVPGFFFCGATVPEEDTYCWHHARIAYQPQYRPPARPYHPLGGTKPAVF